MPSKPNIILIGMPGAGKSTVGCLLAKAMAKSFVDTDLLIQHAEGKRLQEILSDNGYQALRRIEETVILSLDVESTVIATGGSAVYSPRAMAHLAEKGSFVYLKAGIADLRRRVIDLETRGIACPPGYTFEQIYRERSELYEKYAEVTVDCSGLTHGEVVHAVCLQTGGCRKGRRQST